MNQKTLDEETNKFNTSKTKLEEELKAAIVKEEAAMKNIQKKLTALKYG